MTQTPGRASAEPPPSPPVIVDRRRRARAMRSAAAKRMRDQVFKMLCLVVASLSLLILAVLLAAITWQGIGYLNWDFLTSPPHPKPAEAGIYPAIWGTIWICTVCAIVALPLGAATAVFLEEFPPRHRWLKRAHGFVRLNIANLAGVPSVVYGIIGLTVFVQMFNVLGTSVTPDHPAFAWGATYYDQYFNEANRVILVPVESADAPFTQPTQGMEARTFEGERIEINVIPYGVPFPEDPELAARTLRNNALASRIKETTWYYVRIPMGRGVLAGGLTLMLVILPIVIIASQEALRAVPDSLREGALGMGATRWQVVRRVTLPAAIPGIMTGSIIAMSRAIGEAAPLLMIAGIVFITSPPSNLMDDFTALPLQIFNWAGRPQEGFHHAAAAAIIVLLGILLLFNLVAVLIRHKLQKPLT